jgi:hemolysin III
VTAVEAPPPRLRGVLHAWVFWLASAAAAVLVALAPAGEATLAAAIYGAGLCALFAGSALYHRWRWDPRWLPLLRRADHSTIFVFIAASCTPAALLVLDGPPKWILLGGAWTGALAGVAFSVAWIGAPRWLTAATYIGLGWFSLVALPELVERLPVPALLLMAVGGLLYTAGAVVYACRRPDPWPRTFGFHEVFHACVVAAAAVHFVAVAGWVVLPAGT